MQLAKVATALTKISSRTRPNTIEKRFYFIVYFTVLYWYLILTVYSH
jgi:hypothetical protein